MKKARFFAVIVSLLLVTALLMAPFTVSAEEGYPLEDLTLSSASAIVVYVDPSVSGREAIAEGIDSVLYAKAADTPFRPGPLNRLAVGLAAMKIIERKDIDMDTATGEYTYSLFNVYVGGTGLAVANMEFGEQWTIRDLLRLSMVDTAADAATVLAYTLGGSVQLFVDEMNNVAAELGCENTHFTNVSGGDDEGQYTSARDVYKMLRRAMDYPDLVEMLSVSEVTVEPVAGGYDRSWPSTNKLLRKEYFYEPAVLGKTGAADGCYSLASMAEADGYRYITVACGASTPDEQYPDTIALYRWAFNRFTYKSLLADGQPVARVDIKNAWQTDTVNLVASRPVSCLVVNDLDEHTVSRKVTLYEQLLDEDGALQAPVEKGVAVGKVELFIRTDQKIGEVELITAESVKRSELLYIGNSLKAFFLSPWFWGVALLLLALVVAYAVLLYRYNHSTKRRSKSKKYRSLK